MVGTKEWGTETRRATLESVVALVRLQRREIEIVKQQYITVQEKVAWLKTGAQAAKNKPKMRKRPYHPHASFLLLACMFS